MLLVLVVELSFFIPLVDWMLLPDEGVPAVPEFAPAAFIGVPCRALLPLVFFFVVVVLVELCDVPAPSGGGVPPELDV